MNTYVRNIVFSCPGGTWEEYQKEARGLASFYAEILGMQIIREDWFKIAKDADSSPQLAFGDGPGEYRPPSWGDPERPQQMHLDIVVRDLEAADELALVRGATRFQDMGGYRTYADPVGHPFCFYPDDSGSDASTGAVAAGRIGRVVIDCFSPRALASFYEELLGMRRRIEDSPDLVVIAGDDAGLPMLAFQHAPDYTAPRWPDPAYPQQLHLDLYTDDGDAARDAAERLGAIALPAMGGSCPVFADPAGHPFCLCVPGQ